ncbi:S8 family serine peptidase [Streptomyces sp. VRA16 Mangrove soil]|uniref:S8 family serine peptidase n=1 Tax=Streptomyces sp. VRA16 Mangrove soil TaxID=2817434 RepID=UPI001A9E6214|nr:S8 family serine peptidase [Streptomyces sp. VRA16 Mangrove soil]MBO1329950.1 S8 family serine peptidase [Streptomyces sp. VRA16 Mangrove soil]
MRDPRPWWRTVTAATAVAVLAAMAPAAHAAGGPMSATTADPAKPVRTVAVTLITGDVVDARVDADGTVVSAAPRPVDGTDHPAATWQDGGRVYVFPQGVEKLVDAGLVDPALFDIGRLVADGYDDAHTDSLPVVVEYTGGRAARSAAPGTEVTTTLESIGGAGLDVAKKSAADAWADLAPGGARSRAAGGIHKIWLDAKVHGTAAAPLGTPTVPLTGAGQAHRAGLDGSGVKVAVLDTGVDAGHPDLQGRIAATKVFVSGADADDRTGHGTHTASTVAGTGAASDGRYAGMAPGARLLVGKVLGDDGSGSISGIVAGMEWAVDQGAQVVSMSLGADGATSCSGPDVDAVQRLGDKALFVIAAGNASLHGTVSTPGCAPSALTVGAVDRKNATAPFSSRGPSVDGLSAKPDIASQGVDVVAARAGGRGDQAYQEMSGTSMATPHVAGGAALLLQQHPGLPPARLKALLTSSAADSDAPVLEQGAGPLDVARAVTQPVTAPPAPLLGDFAYPQSGLDPVDEPVTLTNGTDHDVTLQLAVRDVRGDDGSRVSGFARPVDRSVTVPAHGTAQVPVHLDPAARLSDGAYGTLTGRLVGTGPSGVRVVVPFGVHMEVPSADLTVKGVDRHGDPAASPSAFQLFDDHRDTATRYTLGYPDAGSTTIRVPLGTYALSGVVMTRDEPGNVGSVASVSQLYRPKLIVSGDTTVTLDARDAERVSWDTDRASSPAGFALGLTVGLDDAQRLKAGYVASVPSYVKDVYAQPVHGDDRLTFLAAARLTAPRAALTTSGGRTLDSLPVQKATEFDGKGSAEVVAVGKGTDANFAAHDLKGRIALVDAGTGGGNAYTWGTAAAKAGAVGVLAAVPDSAGRFQVTGPEGVAQATITWADSLALKAEAEQGRATVTWSGTATAKSPYVYNLATSARGAIRAGTRRVRDRDLAASDARYHVQTATDTTYWSDVEVGLPGIASVWAGGTTLPLQAPQTRTEFFTPSGSAGVTWTTLMRRDLGPYGGTAYDGPHLQEKGHTTATWYKTPYGPVRTTYGRALMTRDSNRLSYVMPPVGDAGGHDSTLARTDYGTRQLLLNGEPLASTAGQFTLPQESADVTFHQDWRRTPSAVDRTGLAYRTTWDFRTSAADQGAQRLLVPVVDVPSDLRNSRPAGEPTTVGLSALVDGSTAPVALDAVRLEYAYGAQSTVDAVTEWRKAEVKPSHGGWLATLPGDAPAGAFVHLRVVLDDGDGARVEQTMVRAYEVR